MFSEGGVVMRGEHQLSEFVVLWDVQSPVVFPEARGVVGPTCGLFWEFSAFAVQCVSDCIFHARCESDHHSDVQLSEVDRFEQGHFLVVIFSFVEPCPSR
jgi:hypothetical protein